MRRLLAILSLLATMVVGLPAGGQGPDPATTERIGDADPIIFAITVSQRRFEDGAASTVTLSRNDNFADSLAGAPLTSEGPLLFTVTDELVPETAAEIDRVLDDGGVIYLLGGTVAVSQAVEDQLIADGYTVERLAGPSRVETALAVATEVRDRFGDTGTVAVARGFGPADNPTAAWADSVAAGAWVAGNGHPLVISPTELLPDSVDAWLAADSPEQTVLLGGEAALSGAVLAAVPAGRRVAGPDRAATAAAIATDLLGFDAAGPRQVIVFNPFAELGWTRGLAVAGLAAELAAPVLAVNQPGIPPATAPLVSAEADEPQVSILVAGPESEISNQIVDELDELDAGPPAPERPTPGQQTLVSVDDDGEPGTDDSTSPDLGRDGSVVIFTSKANNLGVTDGDRQRDATVRDLIAGTTREISGSAAGTSIGNSSAQSLSGDNRYAAVIGRGISQNNIQVYDLVADEVHATTEITDVEPGQGRRPNAVAISDDGQWVAFGLHGSIYRQRRDGTERTEVFAGRNGDGFADLINALWISGDGSRLAFRTNREDLVDSLDHQVFTIDLAGDGQPELVSLGVDGLPAEQQVEDIAMSADGSVIVFSTRAANMAADASGQTTHLYAYQTGTGDLRMLDRLGDGTPSRFGVDGAVNGFGLSLTDDGSEVVFISRAADLVDQQSLDDSIMSIDLTNGTARVEVTPPDDGSVRFPSISGDGTRIAYDRTDEFGGVVQVWIIDRL